MAELFGLEMSERGTIVPASRQTIIDLLAEGRLSHGLSYEDRVDALEQHNLRQAKKRKHVEDQADRPVHKTAATVADHPLDAKPHQLPDAYRHVCNLSRLCSFCGSTSHHKSHCPRFINMCRHSAPKRWRAALCSYPLCPDPTKHFVGACMELHGYCQRCGHRGHRRER